MIDLENIKVEIEDEEQTMLLLCLLPKMHDYFKKTYYMEKSLSLLKKFILF